MGRRKLFTKKDIEALQSMGAPGLIIIGVVLLIIGIVSIIFAVNSYYTFVSIISIIFIFSAIVFLVLGICKTVAKNEGEEDGEIDLTQSISIEEYNGNQKLISEHFEMQNRIIGLYKYRDEPIIRKELISLCEKNIDYYENIKHLLGNNIPCLAYHKLVNLYSQSHEYEKAILVCEKAVTNKQCRPSESYYLEKINTLKKKNEQNPNY